MKLEFSSIQEMVDFLVDIGYEVKKGLTVHTPYIPQNPFSPNYPCTPITYYDSTPQSSTSEFVQPKPEFGAKIVNAATGQVVKE